MADAPTAAAPPRRKLFKHPGRVAVVAISLFVVFNAGIFLFNESDTSPQGEKALPVDIEAISPEPNEITGLIDTVTVDLADQYSGVLVIDGIEIPEDQLDRVVGIQTISFRPGPDKAISRFRAGENEVEVKYWNGRVQDRPEKGTYSFGWSFQGKA
jgi:hypothetical protein